MEKQLLQYSRFIFNGRRLKLKIFTTKIQQTSSLKTRNAPKNKPGTAKVGAVSKAQNCKKGEPLGFVKLQLVAKYEKK